MAAPSTIADPAPDPVSLKRATPKLAVGTQQRRNDDGELVLVGKGGHHVMGVQREEEPLVALLNGERTVEGLVRAGLASVPPVRAMATLALLRRLQASGLLDGLSSVEGLLFARRPTRLARLAQRWDIRIPIPLLGATLAIFRGRLTLSLLPWLGALSLIAGLVATGVRGRWGDLLAPLSGTSLPTDALTAWLATAVVLSWRGLWRGLSFAALDLPQPRAVIRVFAPLVFGDIDDRDRRAASRQQRLHIATSGLAAMALGAGLSIVAWLWLDIDDHRLRLLASAALYLTLADAAPYGKGDGFHLVGILTAIPDLRRRSTAFLLRRSLRNLVRKEPVSALERTYLSVASAWLSHALLTLFILAFFLLPGTLHALAEAVTTAPELEGAWGLTLAIVGSMMAFVTAGLLFGVALIVTGAASQVLWRPKSTPPQSSERVGTEFEDLTAELVKVPFFAALPADELETVISGMRRETHTDGAAIVTQGEIGDRFYFLRQGQTRVVYEEESGLRHQVSRLRAGDFFGEIALIEAVPRTATVVAEGPCEVLTLDRDSFIALVERSKFAREAILDQVRNAAFLRQVRVFTHLGAELMRILLGGVQVLRVDADEIVVHEGDDGDAMYVIREGRCEVARMTGTSGERAIGELNPGDWFGEIAVLRGVERTATVRTLEACTLITVPATVLDNLLMEDLETGLALEQTVARRLVALEAR